MKTKAEIRNAFKAMGYKVSFRTNPFKSTLAHLVIAGNGIVGMMISDATVISAETFNKHKPMFDLLNTVRGTEVDGVKIA